ncbi:MAG TPA: DUF4920 domain-containing protein [Bryobacteraceae bacterium]|nr:DUF4920 domain-containing protein [Bryobacteraceae bacterium]
MRSVILLLASAALVFAGETKLGKPLTLTDQVAIDKLLAAPDQYVGKVVQVKGTVREVCQKMGCWIQIADAATNKAVRIKVKDGDIVFPKDAAGKAAVAEGKFVKLELTKQQAVAQAKHEAEENKKPFSPASVKGPQTVYQIQGTGAVITE